MAAMENLALHPIGMVRSSLKSLQECPLQENEGAPEAILEIDEHHISGLDGIVPGMDLILLTWLHLADRTVLTCFPRNDTNAPFVGVFTTRSPDRPNPIGLHRVRVVEMIGKREIKVFPLEVLDGTFLLDIKPDLSPSR